MENWLKDLRRQASQKGMCAENRAYLSACEDKSDAIRLYKQTIDWALEEHYPSMETLKAEFSDCQGDGLFVSHEICGEVLTDHQAYVLHNCSGHFTVGFNKAKRLNPIIYLADGCDVTIEGKAVNSPIPITYSIISFGGNKVQTTEVDNVKYRVRQK